MDDFVEIFRDNQSWKADLLEVALREKNIPCYRQAGNVTGLVVSPILDSPYCPESIIFVAREKIQVAKDILSELPFDSVETTRKEGTPKTIKTSPEEWARLKRESWMIVLKILAFSAGILLLLYLLKNY